MKYTYHIDSSLDLKEVLDALHKELNLKEGVFWHWDPIEDHEIEEKLPIDELKKKYLETYAEQENIYAIFDQAEISTDEDCIGIKSNVKLELEGIDDVSEKINS